MTIVVRDAWHYLAGPIDVGTPPLARGIVRWDDSGRWLGGFIEEMAPITEKQWEFLHERTKACNLVSSHGYSPSKEKKCMFAHDPCP